MIVTPKIEQNIILGQALNMAWQEACVNNLPKDNASIISRAKELIPLIIQAKKECIK